MLFDLSDRAKFKLTGPDRYRFLNGQLTNDLQDPKIGQAIYACALSAKGKLSGDLYVTPQPDTLLLDWDSALRETMAARLERYIIADDVELHELTDDLTLFHWLGDQPPPALKNDSWIIGKAERFGLPGFDLFAPSAAKKDLLTVLGSVEPESADVLERVRIEQGIPRWGAELSENVIPNEAGIEERAISYTKGCYLGQEVISRIRSVGHVNRHLRGLILRSGSKFAPEDTLWPSRGEKAVGTITSACSSQRLDGWIGLGFVRRGHDEPGTQLEIKRHPTSDLIGIAEVCSLPFLQK